MTAIDQVQSFLVAFDATIPSDEYHPRLREQLASVLNACGSDPLLLTTLIDSMAKRVAVMRESSSHMGWIMTTLVDFSAEYDTALDHSAVDAVVLRLRRGLQQSTAITSIPTNGVQFESEDLMPPPAPRGIFVLVPSIAEQTFLCQICYEHAPLSTAFALSNCGHRFCQPCLAKYLEIKIRDGQIYPPCFHEVETRACGVQISPSDIQAVVSNDIWTKYNTFKFKKETQHPGECPYCGFTQACEGPEHPEVTCVWVSLGVLLRAR